MARSAARRPYCTAERPFLRQPQVMREHVGVFVDELRMPALDGASHAAMQRPLLMRQQAVVGDFSSQHVFEAVRAVRNHGRLLHEPRRLQARERRAGIGALTHGIRPAGRERNRAR